MKTEHRFAAPAAREQVWELMLDMPRVGRCFPGVKEVDAAGDQSYRGTMQVRVGPVSLNISGTMVVTAMDKDLWQASMHVEGADRRLGGGVSGEMLVNLIDLSDSETEVVVSSDISFMGKLGELGQPIIRKKADSILREFADNISRQF
jgi:carbon monoxide dehydrogenase subunit G